MTLSQIVTIIIFLVMFTIIIIGKIHRYIPAVIAAGLVLGVVFLGIERNPQSVADVMNLGPLFRLQFWLPGAAHMESHGVNWQTMFFIIGMMIMVEGLGNVGFFRWICLHAAKLVNYRIVPILVIFFLLSGVLSAFIDSITVLLFMAAVTIELARMLKFNPVPVIIAEIFASNTGGSATMSGDPPNIIIGTSFGFTFSDFAVNTGLIAMAGMAVSLIFFYLVFRKGLNKAQKENGNSHAHYPAPNEAIRNWPRFWCNVGVLVAVVVLLVTHAQTGISVALIGVIAAVLTLALNEGPLRIIQKVDLRTLLFLLGLFVTVGGLEETGVLNALAGYIQSVSHGNLTLVMATILWFSAFASAIIDNIPFAATMVPIVRQLAETSGAGVAPLAWALALGTDIGGNATPIGASANVVGIAIAEREGYHIGWGYFLKYALPAMVLVVGLCQLLLFLKYN